MSDINITRPKRDMQFIFINGRPVQNKNISFHMNDVYRLILPPRAHPFFYVHICLPAHELDVNIHPTKREVKIHDEQRLCTLLRRLCENALMDSGQPKQVHDSKTDSPNTARSSIHHMIRQSLSEQQKNSADLESFFEEPISSRAGKTYRQPPTEQYAFVDTQDAAKEFFRTTQTSLKEKLQHARLIGILINKYILFESPASLLIVDQHAAQERIIFEQLIIQMQNSCIEVQRLLVPLTMAISAQERLRWEDDKDILAKIGFETTQFDEQTIAIHSIPVLIKNPEAAVRELLAAGGLARCDHAHIARRACRSSIMAGDALTSEQAEFQKRQLLECNDPFTCPHGRPVVIETTVDFIDKQFLRTEHR